MVPPKKTGSSHLNGGFFVLPVWGTYIWRGLYMEGIIFWNFTVFITAAADGFTLVKYVRIIAARRDYTYLLNSQMAGMKSMLAFLRISSVVC